MGPPSQSFSNTPRTRVPKSNTLSLSACALKFALAISEPFHPSARNACLPCYPAIDSQKITLFTRFPAVVGTAGMGFVTWGACLASDVPCAYTTTVAFTLATHSVLSANDVYNTGVTPMFFGQNPYFAAQLSNVNGTGLLYGRVVSVGIRVTYVGTTLHESGVYYNLVTPNHESAASVANTSSGIAAFSETEVCGITRKSCSNAMYPISSEEVEYSNSGNRGVAHMLYPFSAGETRFNDNFTNTVAGFSVAPLAGMFVFTGVAGSSMLVEMVQHCEYTGRLAGSLVTSSDSDQRGFEIVTAAARRMTSIQRSEPNARPALAVMKDAILEVAGALKPVAVGVLTRAIGAIVL